MTESSLRMVPTLLRKLFMIHFIVDYLFTIPRNTRRKQQIVLI